MADQNRRGRAGGMGLIFDVGDCVTEGVLGTDVTPFGCHHATVCSSGRRAEANERWSLEVWERIAVPFSSPTSARKSAEIDGRHDAVRFARWITPANTLKGGRMGILNRYDYPICRRPMERIDKKIGALQRLADGYRGKEQFVEMLDALHIEKTSIID